MLFWIDCSLELFEPLNYVDIFAPGFIYVHQNGSIRLMKIVFKSFTSESISFSNKINVLFIIDFVILDLSRFCSIIINPLGNLIFGDKRKNHISLDIWRNSVRKFMGIYFKKFIIICWFWWFDSLNLLNKLFDPIKDYHFTIHRIKFFKFSFLNSLLVIFLFFLNLLIFCKQLCCSFWAYLTLNFHFHFVWSNWIL